MKNLQAEWPFKGKAISFEFYEETIMINATQLASVYGKKVNNFLRMDSTSEFIDELMTAENAKFYQFETKEDILYTNQRHGTFMHRLLAIRFAMWLDAEVAIWVCKKIDGILLSTAKKLKQSQITSAKNRIDLETIKAQLNELQPQLWTKFEELQRIEDQNRRKRNQWIKEEIDLFAEGIQT